MVRKAVPQNSTSKFETHLTIAPGSNLLEDFQNVTVSKSIFRVLVCNKSRKQTGAILLMILKVSIAIVLCLLICSEGMLAYLGTIHMNLSGLHSQNELLFLAPFSVF